MRETWPDKAGTLTMRYDSSPCVDRGGQFVVYAIEPVAAKRMNTEARISRNVSPTLRAEMGDNKPAVVYALANHAPSWGGGDGNAQS